MTVSDESGLKDDLTLACRILAAQGQSDAIFGHVAARLPGWDRFWMKPSGIGLEEVGERDLVLVDFDGRVLAGEGPRHAEYPIHAEVMRARPDVLAVVHTHPRHCIALAARGAELRPVCHEGCFFWPPGVPVFSEFTDLVRTREQGEAVARSLGHARAVFLRNHGVVVVGATVPEACYLAIALERAAEIQLLTQSAPEAEFHHTAEEEALLKQQILTQQHLRPVFEYYARTLPPERG
jgi:L-fuculose-phosphate aldolase